MASTKSSTAVRIAAEEASLQANPLSQPLTHSKSAIFLSRTSRSSYELVALSRHAEERARLVAVRVGAALEPRGAPAEPAQASPLRPFTANPPLMVAPPKKQFWQADFRSSRSEAYNARRRRVFELGSFGWEPAPRRQGRHGLREHHPQNVLLQADAPRGLLVRGQHRGERGDGHQTQTAEAMVHGRVQGQAPGRGILDAACESQPQQNLLGEHRSLCASLSGSLG